VADDGRFRPATLLGLESAGGGLTRVRVEPASDLYAGYRVPGQYVEMRAGGETGFFVLSGEPGERPWELVMRSGGGASDVVLVMKEGSPIELTSAIGQGFPLQAAGGHPLAVVLNGTGIAAAPPLVRWRVRHGDAARTRLFVGVRGLEELALQAELRRWSAEGVDVVVCHSQPADPAVVAPAGVHLAQGYVQDVVRARLAAASSGRPTLDGGHVFAVGSSSMIDGLRALASELGLPEGRVLTNY
jgi:NAD(P)H-flavin reductase